MPAIMAMGGVREGKFYTGLLSVAERWRIGICFYKIITDEHDRRSRS